MTSPQSRYASRSNRPKKPKNMNKLLNILIGVVVLLIVITAGFIFLGNGDENDSASEKRSEETASNAETSDSQDEATDAEDENTESEPEIGAEEIPAEDDENGSTDEGSEDSSTEETPEGSVTTMPSDDPIVSESIVNPAWEPIGTSQSGEHVSIYKEGHVDWNEKVQALAYATGLSSDNMIVWRIENGGSPQKSIGVVTSGNKEEKYRVYLQWVDGEGWKPEKLETLKTLEGAY